MSDYQHHPSRSVIFISLILLAAGYLVHVLQIKFGPRLFLDRILRNSKVHDYFQSPKSKERLNFEGECPICYRTSDEVVTLEKAEKVPYLSRRAQHYISKNKIQVMRTPCGHSFHAVCLLTAMSYRLTCPVCKQRLPNVF